MRISSILGRIILWFRRASEYFIRQYYFTRIAKCGKKVYIGKNSILSCENIEIGDDVYIGPNCVLQSSYGKIVIGNHVMFGPGVNIHGGNHRINEIGKLLKHTTEKKPGDDGVITIEDDCWIGANSIILTNVTIGTGSVIGAGSVVARSVPQCSYIRVS